LYVRAPAFELFYATATHLTEGFKTHIGIDIKVPINFSVGGNHGFVLELPEFFDDHTSDVLLDTHLSSASCVLIDTSAGPETTFATLIANPYSYNTRKAGDIEDLASVYPAKKLTYPTCYVEKNTNKGGPRIFITDFINLAGSTEYKLWFYNLMVPIISTDSTDADSDKRLVNVTLKALDISAGWDGAVLYEDESLLGAIKPNTPTDWISGAGSCNGKCLMTFTTGTAD